MRSLSEQLRHMEQHGPRRTLVEIYGTNRILVECHKGILAYGSEEIRVGTSFGTLLIQGQELRLCCMSREQVFISGTIAGVRLEGGA